MLFVVAAVLFVLMLAGTMRHVFKDHFYDVIFPHLLRYMEYVRDDIGFPADRERARELAEALNINIQINDQHGVWSARGQPVKLESLQAKFYAEQNGVQYEIADLRHYHYLLARYQDLTILFSVQRELTGAQGMRWLWPTGLILLILMLLYHGIRYLFRPIDTIHAGVQHYKEGDFTHRISVSRKDELGQLASSINGMAAEIQRMLDAKRELLLAVSHELRSPLTRAKVSAELVEDPQRRQQIHENLNEIESLVHEILETERLSGGHQVLNRQNCELKKLVLDLLHELGMSNQLVVTLPDKDINISLDPARLRLLLRNLLENTIRHTTEGGSPPEITVNKDVSSITITISDAGAGIEAEHIPHLTEPFYRVDSARQRDTGGYGLGLYLCRMIAEAHGGLLSIKSEPGKGTSVRVSLPL